MRIARDGIDVLVDLNGYTLHGRPGILAHRPAAVGPQQRHEVGDRRLELAGVLARR